MKIWNTTGWEREVGAGGKVYIIKPFAEIEIYNPEHAEHIGNTFAYQGITVLDYNEGMQKLFPTYDEYKKDKEIKALTECLKHYQMVLDCEVNGEEAARNTKGASGELRTFNVDKHEKNVKYILSWLKAAGHVEMVKKQESEKVVLTRPDWSKKNEETKEVL